MELMNKNLILRFQVGDKKPQLSHTCMYACVCVYCVCIDVCLHLCIVCMSGLTIHT